MTVTNFEHHAEGRQLDAAISAILSEEIPVGPPASVADNLSPKWAQADVHSGRYHLIPKLNRLAVVAAVIVGLAVSWNLFDQRSNIALADISREFQKAKSIQFRHVMYAHHYDDSEKSSVWRGTSYVDCNFKAPGLSREVTFDEDGVPWQIVTKDKTRGITLELRLATKQAILTENPPPPSPSCGGG
ncbi:MAG: hypothetical protein V4719_12955 [Planctomycetota bacterium]